MKAKKIIFYILMFIPLIVVLISLQFLPEQIPAHFGADNQVTRYGSKFEVFILPGVTIIFGIFMILVSKYAAKQEKHGKSNENVCIITGIVCLILFNAMTGYFLYVDFRSIENLSFVPVDISRMIFGIVGVLIVITGNIMPKLRKNSLIGLRTKWSMKNETTWKKSQRFGGISMILGGTSIVIISLLTGGILCVVLTIAVISVVLVCDIVYTYRVSLKY